MTDKFIHCDKMRVKLTHRAMDIIQKLHNAPYRQQFRQTQNPNMEDFLDSSVEAYEIW